MTKLSQIIAGFKGYAFTSKSIEHIAQYRAKICEKCPSAVKSIVSKIMPDYSIKEIQGYKCIECGCPLSTKLRSPETNCPLNQWTSVQDN